MISGPFYTIKYISSAAMHRVSNNLSSVIIPEGRMYVAAAPWQ